MRNEKREREKENNELKENNKSVKWQNGKL